MLINNVKNFYFSFKKNYRVDPLLVFLFFCIAINIFLSVFLCFELVRVNLLIDMLVEGMNQKKLLFDSIENQIENLKNE